MADPFAIVVLDYDPAPGQFVNVFGLDDPARALGSPVGGGTAVAGNSSVVTLGGFGGTLVLGFDHTVTDDAANPFGMDFIVYGNAFWSAGNPNLRFGEPGVIEISRDTNSNGMPDDTWYLIPGSLISDPNAQWFVQTWDDNLLDNTFPPIQTSTNGVDLSWIPPGRSGVWTSEGYLLPDLFTGSVLPNPLGTAATQEGIFGYTDLSPTLVLGDLNGDNVEDDPFIKPEDFYTIPDDPFTIGVTAGSGGGDAMDIAWAIDPVTGAPANLGGFDFIRIRTGVDIIRDDTGEVSTEIDAVADVAAGMIGDANADGEINLFDAAVLINCLMGPVTPAPPSPCRVMDFDQDGDVDLRDASDLSVAFTIPPMGPSR